MILEILRQNLKDNHYTCVIGNENEIIFKSKDKGVKPLLDFYKLQIYKKYEHIYVADKIIGKGAAFLLVAMGTKGIYTPIISVSAEKLLQQHHLEIRRDQVVPYIKNRVGDGACPIESAVQNENDVNKALNEIEQTLKKLRKVKNKEINIP